MVDYRKNFVIALLSYAIQKDIPAQQLCRLAGINWQSLQGNKAVRISAMQLELLWQHVLELSADPLFGLHFGELMQRSALGVIGTIIRNSFTVGEALEKCAAYSYLLTDLFDMKVIRPRSRNGFTVKLLPFKNKTAAFPLMQRQTLELSMAFILHELDGLLLTKMKPEKVIIPHARKHRSEFERVLRCKKVSNGKEYRMDFDDVLWDAPILSANYQLQSLLLQYAESNKHLMNQNGSVSARINSLLKKNTYLGIPALKEIAANLHVSPRSLQRRLREEGITYQELTGNIRKTMAIHYLDNNQHPIGEIARMLGYRRLSAFTRAFRSWTGMTPQQYRK